MNRPPQHRAEEISAQAAALAAHLQRSGIVLLPRPNAERAEELAAAMKPTEVTEHSSAVAGSVQRNTASAQTKPAQTAPAPSGSAPTSPTTQTPPRRLDSVAAVSSDLVDYPTADIPREDRVAALEVVDAEVRACTRCEVLSNCRTHTVFGEGSPTPRFAFFGEGPGADEDRSGRPFVGRAGQLLTKMIEACTLKREDVYILNTVKCRPPGNRNPEPEEISNCRPFYARQLEILRPQYIVCLGAISAQELLNSKLSVGRLRGKLHQYYGSKVLVTYHPAYLLRNPSAKKATWQDLQLMLRDAEITLP